LGSTTGKDESGALKAVMEETVDGEYQRYQVKGGAYTRENSLVNTQKLKNLVKDLSDEDIDNLNRGGHDPYKVFAAYAEA
jgi:pyruvate dehydrogenase E1 component